MREEGGRGRRKEREEKGGRKDGGRKEGGRKEE